MRIISENGLVDIGYETSQLEIWVGENTKLRATTGAFNAYIGWFKDRQEATDELQAIRQSFVDGRPYHYIGGQHD